VIYLIVGLDRHTFARWHQNSSVVEDEPVKAATPVLTPVA
jgi:hypothetical protein